MRTSEGIPISSMVRRSASRICAELSRGMGTVGLTADAPYGPTLARRIAQEVRSLSMAATVNVNGRVFDQEHALISVFDHGFLYGEGVYETLRTYNGQPFLADRHLRRLRRSAEMLALPIPLSDADIDARFRDTMRAAGLGEEREVYLRILVTRGVGELSYDPAACPTSSVVVIAKPHVDPPRAVFEQGVTVALVPIVRNHPGSVNPLIKSNNLLNN